MKNGPVQWTRRKRWREPNTNQERKINMAASVFSSIQDSICSSGTLPFPDGHIHHHQTVFSDDIQLDELSDMPIITVGFSPDVFLAFKQISRRRGGRRLRTLTCRLREQQNLALVPLHQALNRCVSFISANQCHFCCSLGLSPKAFAIQVHSTTPTLSASQHTFTDDI